MFYASVKSLVIVFSFLQCFFNMSHPLLAFYVIFCCIFHVLSSYINAGLKYALYSNLHCPEAMKFESLWFNFEEFFGVSGLSSFTSEICIAVISRKKNIGMTFSFSHILYFL